MSDRIDIQIEVAFAFETGLEQRLQEAIQATVAHERAQSEATVNLLLSDDATVQALNSTYRGYDRPTDVLSFSDGEPSVPNGPIHLGDIIISVPQAERQAIAGGHVVSAEILLLTVHGTLHLLGHDHGTPAEKERMWAAQSAILTQLNAPITSPTETKTQ